MLPSKTTFFGNSAASKSPKIFFNDQSQAADSPASSFSPLSSPAGSPKSEAESMPSSPTPLDSTPMDVDQPMPIIEEPIYMEMFSGGEVREEVLNPSSPRPPEVEPLTPPLNNVSDLEVPTLETSESETDEEESKRCFGEVIVLPPIPDNLHSNKELSDYFTDALGLCQGIQWNIGGPNKPGFWSSFEIESGSYESSRVIDTIFPFLFKRS